MTILKIPKFPLLPFFSSVFKKLHFYNSCPISSLLWGRARDFHSIKQPNTRLQGYTNVFCSIACRRERSSSSKTVLPVGDSLKSPGVSMFQFSDNIQISLHLLPLHKLEYELWSLRPGYGLYPEVNYIDDERAEGRHHPPRRGGERTSAANYQIRPSFAEIRPKSDHLFLINQTKIGPK